MMITIDCTVGIMFYHGTFGHLGIWACNNWMTFMELIVLLWFLKQKDD